METACLLEHIASDCWETSGISPIRLFLNFSASLSDWTTECSYHLLALFEIITSSLPTTHTNTFPQEAITSPFTLTKVIHLLNWPSTRPASDSTFHYRLTHEYQPLPRTEDLTHIKAQSFRSCLQHSLHKSSPNNVLMVQLTLIKQVSH